MRRRDAYIDQLAAVPMFAACSKADLRLIARLVDPYNGGPGDVLVREGTKGREFFIIVSGTAEVERNGEVVTTLGPGAFFGELALLDRAPRNATVRATEPIEVIVIGEREFAGLLAEVPVLSRKVMTAMAHRLHHADAVAAG